MGLEQLKLVKIFNLLSYGSLVSVHSIAATSQATPYNCLDLIVAMNPQS